MSSETRLTPTSYIVLGLLEAAGESTPYAMKQMVAAGLGDFWSIQHAQLYTEPKRLAAAGFVSERQEEGGRHRRYYKITPEGREALRLWLEEPAAELTEFRHPGLLRLFFGAKPESLAKVQVPMHQRKLADYEKLLDQLGPDAPDGIRLPVEAGMEHQREWVSFWSRFVE